MGRVRRAERQRAHMQQSVQRRRQARLDAATTILPVQGEEIIFRHDAAVPPMLRVVHPVSRIPDWGAMYSAAEWDRPFGELTWQEFVPVPLYNLNLLIRPLEELLGDREKNRAVITAKLYYSTRFFAKYSVDADEFSGRHVGVDLKLPFGMPIGSIGGGVIHGVRENAVLGTFVIVEHNHPTEGTLFSVYGHLGNVTVREGDVMKPGDILGTIGMTGNTSGPHLHLQVDRKRGEGMHEPFLAEKNLTAQQADAWTMHPIRFIERYAAGI